MQSQVLPSLVDAEVDQDVVDHVGDQNAKGETALNLIIKVVGPIHARDDQHLEHHEVKVKTVEEDVGEAWEERVLEHDGEPLLLGVQLE